MSHVCLHHKHFVSVARSSSRAASSCSCVALVAGRRVADRGKEVRGECMEKPSPGLVWFCDGLCLVKYP